MKRIFYQKHVRDGQNINHFDHTKDAGLDSWPIFVQAGTTLIASGVAPCRVVGVEINTIHGSVRSLYQWRGTPRTRRRFITL